MSKSPITVQQWIESLPPQNKVEPSPSNTPIEVQNTPQKIRKKFLPREMSLQSDDASSHCSSVESVLEHRKPDPEAVLISLGFGPSKPSNLLSKIPQRFLQPSKLITNIDLEKFLQQYGETPEELAEIRNPISPLERALTKSRLL